MSSFSSTTTTTIAPSGSLHTFRLKPSTTDSNETNSDLPPLEDEHRAVLGIESWKRQPFDFTDLLQRVHTEYNPLLHEKEYVACAKELTKEVELFGKTFERYNGDDASSAGSIESSHPLTKHKEVHQSSSNKGKSISTFVQPKYQFQSMMAMGIPKEEIHRFTEPACWLKYHEDQTFKELKEKSDRFGSWFESKWHELDSRLRIYEYDVKKFVAEANAEKAQAGETTMKCRSQFAEKQKEIKVCEIETTALQHLLKRQKAAIEAVLTETDDYLSRECRRKYTSFITSGTRKASSSGFPWQCQSLESFHVRYNKIHNTLASAAPITTPEDIIALKAWESQEKEKKERRALKRREMRAARRASKDGSSRQRTRGWNEYDDGEFADGNGSMSVSPFDSRAPSIMENVQNDVGATAAGLHHDPQETLSRFILQSCVDAGSALLGVFKKPFAASDQSVRSSRASTLRSGRTTRQGSRDTLLEHESASERQGLLSGQPAVDSPQDKSRPISREMKYQTFGESSQPESPKMGFMEVVCPCI